MNYRSVEDLNQIILRNLHRIPSDVDFVVGIPRSGLMAANLTALYLNRPLTDLQGLGEKRLLHKGKRPIRGDNEDLFSGHGKILVVDDCISQGTEMKRAKTLVKEQGFSDRAFFLAVFSFPENPGVADLVMQVIPRPMCFQWSVMHTPELQFYCLDIDGILCVDCPKEDDDDGPRYREFLKTARPIFLPTVEIGWLVTSRLERYRNLTEEWLARNNVKYRELIMMDLPSKDAREQSGMHAAYKAEAYKRSGALLFIESCPAHAEKIAELSGLPVLSMVTNRLIGNPEYDRIVIRLARVSYWLRRLKRVPRRLASELLKLTRIPRE